MPGTRFTVSADPYTGAANAEYIIRSVNSSGHDEKWVAGGGGSEYTNRIVAFPSATVWREKFVTPRPVMAGIHSAVVIGDAGEEIHSEQYGRVKVSFFWDHRKTITAGNGNNTVWGDGGNDMITGSGDFTVTHNCGASLAPNAVQRMVHRRIPLIGFAQAGGSGFFDDGG